MTSEEEKRLILLSAIIRLGGAGSKNAVLDEITHANLIKLSPSDLEIIRSRNEIKWRNDLAYVRKHLVTEGHLLATAWNSWRITDKGRTHHASLADLASRQKSFRHLNVESIQAIIQQVKLVDISDDNALTGETRFEGQQVQTWTTRYERDSKLRVAAITLHGTVCMGCGFNFEKKYGAIGAGFIEVHHTKPISSLGGSTQVDPSTDFVVLCSNCHSIVHRRQQSPLSIEELQDAISGHSV